MELLGYFIDKNNLIIGLAVFFGLIFILTLIALINSVRANKKMKKLLDNNKGNDIIEVINEYYDKCHSIEGNFSDIREKVSFHEKESKVYESKEKMLPKAKKNRFSDYASDGYLNDFDMMENQMKINKAEYL